jgi:hypothetical protein
MRMQSIFVALLLEKIADTTIMKGFTANYRMFSFFRQKVTFQWSFLLIGSLSKFCKFCRFDEIMHRDKYVLNLSTVYCK